MKFSIALLAASAGTAIAAGFMATCRNARYVETGRLAAECQWAAGIWRGDAQLDLNYCVGNHYGTMVAQDNGGAFASCRNCRAVDLAVLSFGLECECNDGKGNWPTSKVSINNIVTNDAGLLTCYGHYGTPY